VTSHASSACYKECEAGNELQLMARDYRKWDLAVGRVIEMLINAEQQ